MDVPLDKYAGLFVDEKVAKAVAEEAEKIAAETGVSKLVAVDDILNQLSQEG